MADFFLAIHHIFFLIFKQCAKKAVSNSLGVVNFVVRLVDRQSLACLMGKLSVLGKIFVEIQITEVQEKIK